MTPLHIQMLLHYYAIAEPYAMRDPEHANSRAVQAYRLQLVTMELIRRDETSPSGYMATDKGIAFIDMLLATPMPVQKWSAP